MFVKFSQTESSPHDWEEFAMGSVFVKLICIVTQHKAAWFESHIFVNGDSSVDNLSVIFCQNVMAPLMRGMVCRGVCRYLEFWRKNVKQYQSLRVILVLI